MSKKCYYKNNNQKIKIKTFLKTSIVYKVDYKIQDTDGFHKIHLSRCRAPPHEATPRVRLVSPMIQGTTATSFPFPTRQTGHHSEPTWSMHRYTADTRQDQPDETAK